MAAAIGLPAEGVDVGYMKFLDLTPRDYEPPGLCHTGIEELFAVGALGAGEAAAGGAAATGAAAGLTAADFSLGLGETLAATSSLPSLSTLGTVASVGGSLLQAKGQADQAAYEQEVAKNQALALRQKANEDAAAGQRRQIAAERQAGLVTSRARALAADSGTDASSPTEVNIEQKIAGQGQYNALSSLYEGLAASRADTYQADIDLFKAKRIGASVPLAVGGTLLSGLSSFADRKSRLKYFTSSGGDNSFFGGF